jgi:hypothetical protein
MSLVFRVRRQSVPLYSRTKTSTTLRPLKCLIGKFSPYPFSFATNVRSYDKLTLQTFLRNHPDFRYCIGLGCPFGQLHDAEDGNIFICATCGHCSCVNHNIAFQSGETCEQYDTRKAREDKAISEMNKATMDLLEKETKKCPGCGYRIEKTRGCDRVTCKFIILLGEALTDNRIGSQCQFQFCYQCSASYNGEGGIRSMGNIAHADDCAHHFDNLPSNPFAVYGMARFGSASSSFGGAFGSATFGTGSSASGLGAIDYIDDEDITDDEDVTDDEDITDDEDNSSISPESDVYPPYIRAVTNTSASGDATEAKEKQEAVEKSTAKETSPAAARDPSDHDKASEKHSSAVPNAAHQAPIPRSNDTSNQATEPASRMHTSADPTIVASIMARKRRRYPWMGQSAVEQMSGSLGSLSVNSPADQSSVDKSRKG